MAAKQSGFMKRKPLLGLALGGGGARGLAHIGVLQILESAGLKPDLLAGTSMGAVIAALYAAGYSPKRIEQEAHHFTKTSSMLKLMVDDLSFDYLVSAESIQEYFQERLNDIHQFTDLQMPVAFSAVDINSAQEVALDHGALIPAINASMALPGIAQPVELNDMRLIDGGALNNVPSDLVRSMGADVVVAVDVSPDVTDEAFWNEQRLPHIAAANWRSNAIMVATITAAKQRAARTDIYLKPDIPARITTLSGFSHVQDITDAGARAAKNALPEIRALCQPRFSLRKKRISNAKPAQL